MTSNKARLDKLNNVLSAKERALLVLRSWKDGTEEEPRWRWTMLAEQTPAFNRYIGLMNAVNRALGPLPAARKGNLSRVNALGRERFVQGRECLPSVESECGRASR